MPAVTCFCQKICSRPESGPGAAGWAIFVRSGFLKRALPWQVKPGLVRGAGGSSPLGAFCNDACHFHGATAGFAAGGDNVPPLPFGAEQDARLQAWNQRI
jgi:hypothetical protein